MKERNSISGWNSAVYSSGQTKRSSQYLSCLKPVNPIIQRWQKKKTSIPKEKNVYLRYLKKYS